MTCSEIQTINHTSCGNQPSRKNHGILPLYLFFFFFFACSKVYGLVGLPTHFMIGREDIDLPKRILKAWFQIKAILVELFTKGFTLCCCQDTYRL